MPFSLSTRWNAFRSRSGESLVDDILELGFEHIELGYDLTADLVPGVFARVESGAIGVTSVHNFCPVPVGAPYGHPELFLLGSLVPRIRNSAILHTVRTIEFAAEMGASCVVVHGGRVKMGNLTRKLIGLAEDGKQFDLKFEKLKQKVLLKRDRKAPKYVDALCSSLEELLPRLEEHGICLALENLPSWEAVPTEMEMEEIARRIDSPLIGYWHDIGHGQVRENLGFVHSVRWVERLRERLAGMHIHDVVPPASDHAMPPAGEVDFASFKDFVEPSMPLVFEPVPGTPAEELVEGLRVVQEAWEM